jgi:hypothetical protein
MKSNRLETQGKDDIICSTLCIGKDIRHRMTHGSTKKTSMPQNSFKLSTPIPPQLDEQMYKRQPIVLPKSPSSHYIDMSQQSSLELEYLGPCSLTPQLAIHNGGPITTLSEQELLEENAAVHNSAARAAYHTSLIPRARDLFDQPLYKTIQAFRDRPPTRTSSLHNPQLHHA